MGMEEWRGRGEGGSEETKWGWGQEVLSRSHRWKWGLCRGHFFPAILL